jgi:predicted AAA+ superfamily ATPase
MGGFDMAEVGSDESSKLWLRGGFPDSFTAANESNSFSWRKNFIQTFLERDLPSAGISIEPPALYRFWSMLAHYHGQIWNASEPGRSLGVSQPTVRRYLDLLTGFFMVRQLAPWHANLKKRQVKSPKIYFRDSGLLHQILGIRLEKDLLTSPKCGASWEGYVIEEVIQAFNPDESYFWATHNGAEIDLLMVKEGGVYGVECKRMDAPKMTPSMQIAMTDLNLKRMAVIYPGAKRFPLADGIEAVPLQDLAQGGQALFP